MARMVLYLPGDDEIPPADDVSPAITAAPEPASVIENAAPALPDAGRHQHTRGSTAHISSVVRRSHHSTRVDSKPGQRRERGYEQSGSAQRSKQRSAPPAPQRQRTTRPAPQSSAPSLGIWLWCPDCEHGFRRGEERRAYDYLRCPNPGCVANAEQAIPWRLIRQRHPAFPEQPLPSVPYHVAERPRAAQQSGPRLDKAAEAPAGTALKAGQRDTLEALLLLRGWDPAVFAIQAGKPIEALNQSELRTWIAQLTDKVEQESPQQRDDQGAREADKTGQAVNRRLRGRKERQD